MSKIHPYWAPLDSEKAVTTFMKYLIEHESTVEILLPRNNEMHVVGVDDRKFVVTVREVKL